MQDLGIDDPEHLEAQDNRSSTAASTRSTRAGSALARTALFTATLFSVFASHEQGMIPDSQMIQYQWQPKTRTMDTMNHLNFHLVRGRPMHGMLVDTGAAKAIMGTDTMKEYITDILSKYGKVIEVKPSDSRFTGIGGRQEKSKRLAETPLGIPLPGIAEVTIDLDLLGDLGSKCPGLLPLSVLLRLQS